MKFFRWLASGATDLFCGFWRTVVQVMHSFGLATCLALFAASIALASTSGWFDWFAQFVPVLGPAVLAVFKGGLTCFMAFVAGFGFCYCNSELIKEQSEKKAEEIAKTLMEKKSLKAENDRLSQDCEAKEIELKKLREQNAALRSARIDINAFAPILKISLAEVKMSVKEYYQQWIANSLRKSSLHRPTAKQFIGVCKKDFETRLEVDLNKASIRVNGNTIYVGNLKLEPFAGESHTEWLIGEIHEYKMRNAKSTEESKVYDHEEGYVPDEKAKNEEGVVTYFGGDELYEAQKDFERQLSERIKKTDFKGYDLAIRFGKKAAEQFVRMILAPCEANGYRLDFSHEEEEMETWQDKRYDLIDYVAEYNERQLAGKLLTSGSDKER